MRLVRLRLTNFLSYRDATLEFGDFTALVGPNSSGKSNAVAALKLLRDIPTYGLPTAIARRGGFDQMRHRSEGRPRDPALMIDFTVRDGLPESRYELRLASRAGGRYAVKLESGKVHGPRGMSTFRHELGRLEMSYPEPNKAKRSTERGPLAPAEHESPSTLSREWKIPVGQSALPLVFPVLPVRLLEGIRTVNVNPSHVAELQEPTSTRELDSDGSNVASYYELLRKPERSALLDEMSALIPDIASIEPWHLADRVTLTFGQRTNGKIREFAAKSMSDGTLRVLGILLSLRQLEPPTIIAIEEPEVAIHLGALRTLVDILKQYSERNQIVITTHSADIVDALDIDELRVVWMKDGASQISSVAEHTRSSVMSGLVTPAELLRSDALDPVGR